MQVISQYPLFRPLMVIYALWYYLRNYILIIFFLCISVYIITVYGSKQSFFAEDMLYYPSAMSSVDGGAGYIFYRDNDQDYVDCGKFPKIRPFSGRSIDLGEVF